MVCNLKRIVVMLAVGIVSMACSKSGSSPVDLDKVKDERLEIKVMTYNVHHCNPPASPNLIDVAAIAKVIKDESPDFVALQEIDVMTTRSGKDLDQAKELGRLTGMHYFFAKAIDLQGGAYGVAILSKLPFLETDKQLLPMKDGLSGEQRVIGWVTVQLENGKKMIFASTHFDLQDHRLVQAEKITEIFKNKAHPVILGGDFNETPGSTAINYLDRNFARTCKQSCFSTSPASFPTKAIDLIFYKSINAFEVVKNYAVQEKLASDHLPLCAVLKVN